MMDSFSKFEAVQYLGEVFSFKSDFTESNETSSPRTIKAGEVGKIKSVDVWDGVIKLCLDVYGDYFSVTKPEFLEHCQLLKPVITEVKH